MICLYRRLFFNIFDGIVQIFIKPWNQRPYPRVIEVCRLSFGPGHVFFLQLTIVVEYFPTDSRNHFFTFCRFITLP
jgi:hypothetical protein